jgi:hypothetical protein
MENIKKYYKIVDEDNDKPYASYYQKIVWIVQDFIEDSSGCGFIVQKVSVVDTAGVSRGEDRIDFGKEPYYEAWKVVTGVVSVEDSSGDYDDCFTSGENTPALFLKAASVNKRGIITYNSDVYWVDIKNPLYHYVDSWRRDEVVQAGGLRSVWESEMKMELGESVTSRSFEHHIDYQKDDFGVVEGTLT